MNSEEAPKVSPEDSSNESTGREHHNLDTLISSLDQSAIAGILDQAYVGSTAIEQLEATAGAHFATISEQIAEISTGAVKASKLATGTVLLDISPLSVLGSLDLDALRPNFDFLEDFRTSAAFAGISPPSALGSLDLDVLRPNFDFLEDFRTSAAFADISPPSALGSLDLDALRPNFDFLEDFRTSAAFADISSLSALGSLDLDVLRPNFDFLEDFRTSAAFAGISPPSALGSLDLDALRPNFDFLEDFRAIVFPGIDTILPPTLDISAIVGPMIAEFERFHTDLKKQVDDAKQIAPLLKAAGLWFSPSVPLQLWFRLRKLYHEGVLTVQIIQQLFMDEFRANNLELLHFMVSDWMDQPEYGVRERFIRAALSAHARNEFSLSVMPLLAMADGIICDWFNWKKLESNKFTKLLRHYDLEYPLHLVGVVVFTHFIDKFFRSQMDANANIDTLNRHNTLHGQNLFYDTEIHSLRGFLLLDEIYWTVIREQGVSPN